jgi:two-component system, chemotaxis family, sensor kinase CheA
VNDLDEIVAEFLVESHENLDQMDRDIIALEQDPRSRSLLGNVFRTVHTIKGTTGFLGFGRLQELTHAGEGLLGRLRDGDLLLTPEVSRVLLLMADAVRAMLAVIEQTGAEGTPDHASLIAELTLLQEKSDVPAEPAPPPPSLIGQLVVAQESLSPAGMTAPAAGPEPIADIPDRDTPATSPHSSPVVPSQVDRRSLADRSIRVEVDLLDSLMRLVGELVLTRNEIVEYATLGRDVPLARASSRLNSITSELREDVMKTRMQRMELIWSKLPRLVHDLCGTCGKAVRMQMQGQDTELDKSILAAMKDPLTHLVRNAVDHGMELPAARRSAGKDGQGLLLLRAYHQSGQVNVDIRDDGAGLNPTLIAATARKRGLITDEQLTAMDDSEINRLIFLPGFSTAEQVTNISGRGVGLDVVKTNIEKVGGSVDVTSVLGVGTTFRITIPLTLAIIQVLTVTCRGNRYAIPQNHLVELVRLPDGPVVNGIELIADTPVYRLRDSLLPVVCLDQQLGFLPSLLDKRDAGAVIAVLEVDGARFGLLVDDVLDVEEIVVKPLGAQLRSAPIYAGATILGDGGVVLILDIAAAAEQARVLRPGRTRPLNATEPPAPAESRESEALLIATIGTDRRVGIPVSMVTRLERFPGAMIERVGACEVVQYRGDILPLRWLAQLLDPSHVPTTRDPLQVIVYIENGRSVGLIVDAIHDIVDAPPRARSEAGDDVASSLVVQHRVTHRLDLRRAIIADSSVCGPASLTPGSAL